MVVPLGEVEATARERDDKGVAPCPMRTLSTKGWLLMLLIDG